MLIVKKYVIKRKRKNRYFNLNWGESNYGFKSLGVWVSNKGRNMAVSYTHLDVYKRQAFIKAFIITVIIALISEYALLIPLNPRSPQFILYFSFLLLIFNGVYFIFNRGFNKIMKYSLILAGILIVLIPVGTFISSPIFNAKSYQKQLVLDKKADFYKDNKTISYESIPVVEDVYKRQLLVRLV